MGVAERQTTACPKVGAACCPETLGRGVEYKLLCVCVRVRWGCGGGALGVRTHAECVHFPTSQLFRVTLACGYGWVGLSTQALPAPAGMPCSITLPPGV